MLRTTLNRYSEEFSSYDKLLSAMEARYGRGTQALVLALYEELLFSRRMLCSDPESAILQARIAVLRKQIQGLYSQDRFPRSRRFPLTYVSADPLIIEYPRDIFEHRYGSVAEIVRSETYLLRGPTLQSLVPWVPYMFVVDDELTLRVWSRQFRFNDLVFGRNRATVNGVPVAHPTLVPERLRVTAAGEIVFVGSPDRPSAAVINTKSGHFWPPPSSGMVIRRVLSDAFGLRNRDIDLFTMPLARNADAIRSDPNAQR